MITFAVSAYDVFSTNNMTMTNTEMKKATLGGGCFWCIEAVFEEIKGVQSVVSGYAGGHKENPTYEEVSAGTTGHAEVVQITYNPEEISYGKLLDIFWHSHNPTTRNRQGPDVGSQYRSIILYHNEEQKKMAEQSRHAFEQSGEYDEPVVTEIKPLQVFYKAEEYHQDFYKKHPNSTYCRIQIDPKIKKIEKLFEGEIK